MPFSPSSAIKLYRGVSIYQVSGSANWYVRVWDRERKRYIVKSTGERTAVRARELAKAFALELLRSEKPVDRQFTFRHFALTCLANGSAMVNKGERNANYVRTLQWTIQNEDWGLLRRFGPRDVRSIKMHDFKSYMRDLDGTHPHLSSSTKNTITAAFRNVLKVARDEGVIEHVPDTPRTRQKDNPRPFFRFHPLISKEKDAYKKLLETAKEIAKERVVVRGVPVTDELYDLILFVTHSFVRPTVTELYAIKHNDITVADEPERLILTVRNGKTGYRSSNTMSGCVYVYRRICRRYPDARGEDYIFLPQYLNRETASKIIRRQFNELLSVPPWKEMYLQEPVTRSTPCDTQRSACASSCRKGK